MKRSMVPTHRLYVYYKNGTGVSKAYHSISEAWFNGRYIIVPEALYNEAIKAAKEGDNCFELKEGKPYFLDAAIIINKITQNMKKSEINGLKHDKVFMNEASDVLNELSRPYTLDDAKKAIDDYGGDYRLSWNKVAILYNQRKTSELRVKIEVIRLENVRLKKALIEANSKIESLTKKP